MNKILFILSYAVGVLFANISTISSLSGIFAFLYTGDTKYLIVGIALSMLFLSIKIENDV